MALTPDGKLTPQTIASLNVPLSVPRQPDRRHAGALALAAERVRQRAADGEPAGVRAARLSGGTSRPQRWTSP